MPYVVPTEGCVRDPTHRNDDTSAGELACELHALCDLATGWSPVGRGAPRMGGDDVPEQHVVANTKLRKHAVNNGRGRFGRAITAHLPFRGERKPRDASAAIAGRLCHKEHRRALPLIEISREPVTKQRCPVPVPVEVERVTDLGRRKFTHESLHLGAYFDRRWANAA